MAKQTVKVYQPWAEVLAWCQEHVGNLLWSQPIVAWHGEGWHMRSGSDVAPRGSMGDYWVVVEFDDPKKATEFALIWS